MAPEMHIIHLLEKQWVHLDVVAYPIVMKMVIIVLDMHLDGQEENVYYWAVFTWEMLPVDPLQVANVPMVGVMMKVVLVDMIKPTESHIQNVVVLVLCVLVTLVEERL